MTKFFAKIAADECGATAIEYALLVAVVAVGLITSMQGLKGEMETLFTNVGTKVNEAGATE